MTKVLISAEHDHPAINGHQSSGYVTLFMDNTEIHFESLFLEDQDNFCVQTSVNGKIVFPIQSVWTIVYG